MRTNYSVCLIAGMVLLLSCNKYLAEKPDNKLVVPSTLNDLQAILDYYSRINQFTPGSAEASADNFYLTTNDYKSLGLETDRRIYTWEKDFVIKSFPNDWSYSWDNIYRANTVLSIIPTIERNTANALVWDNIKGQALVLRAKCMLQLAYVFCLGYDSITAKSNLGLPLRTNPDFNTLSVRASLQETYDQIENDLLEAAPLLPDAPLHVMRFAKPAAFGLLARLYLSKRQYEKAGIYADNSLSLYKTLMDYNSFTPTANFPFARLNPEVLWESWVFQPATTSSNYAKIDSFLYASYGNNDLRKSLFFRNNGTNTYAFKGSYEGSDNLFDGVAVDELFLVRAEAYARAGNTNMAMADLNNLIVKRFKTGSFVPVTAANSADALAKVLTERRKELLFRGLRWMDIKRLNLEGAGITLTRLVNNQLLTLPPNDLRFAIAIPEDVVTASGMQQNPR